MQRGRSSGAPVGGPSSKLGVPRPVNLPSLRRENAGNDPSTQIVPAGNTGGWTKPVVPSAAASDTKEVPLAASSTWGSSAARSAAAPWQPPNSARSAPPAHSSGAFQPRAPILDRRRLNPAEYPSLDVAATAKAALAAQLAIRSSALVSHSSSQVQEYAINFLSSVLPLPPPSPPSKHTYSQTINTNPHGLWVRKIIWRLYQFSDHKYFRNFHALH